MHTMRSAGESARRTWRSYYWDIVLGVIPTWFGAMFDLWGVLSYLGGLINVPFALIALLMSVMLVPAVPLCLVVLLVRMLFVWPRHIRGRGRLLAAWGMVGGVFLLAFVLPFILASWSPREAFMAGFRRHVLRRVDVPAVQNWLSTLEPSGPRPPDQGNAEIPVDESDIPKSIAQLRAWGTEVRLDDMGRPMIWLMWGSGVMGGWGLVVGDRDMETPPSDFSQYGEVRTTIAPGAYTWYELP